MSARTQVVLAAAGYLLFALVLTWPVVTDPAGRMFGFAGSDLMGSAAQLREILQSGEVPFLPGEMRDLGRPEGAPIAWEVGLASLPSALVLTALGATVGATAALWLFAVAGWAGSALAMFLLARRVTGSAPAAAVAGLATGFFPYLVLAGTGHNHFVHVWLFVLVGWAFLSLHERPSARTGLIAGAAVLLAMWWTPYFTLLAGVEAATLGVLVLAAGRSRERVRALAAAAAAPLALLVALGVLAATSDPTGVPDNDRNDLEVYAARVYEYVVPARSHPLLGERAARFSDRRQHRSNPTETTLYLGLSVLALALLGAIAAWRRRQRAVVLGALGVALVALLMSLPPPGPSALVFELVPAWRVYARFVLLVMPAVALLAAVGVARLLRGRGTTAQLALAALAGLVVAADLYGRPDTAVSETRAPAIYEQLRALPAGTVAEYPIAPAEDPDYADLFFQDAHGKPLLNGYAIGSFEEARALELATLTDAASARGLATLGVRYVLLNRQPYGTAPDRTGAIGAGLRQLADDGRRVLFEVTARPGVLVTPHPGFEEPEGDGYRWMNDDEARITVEGPCSPCDGVLRFRAWSFHTERRLTVSGPDGRVLHEQAIPQDPVDVEVPLRVDRSAVVTLRVDRAPTTIGDVTDSPDHRAVTLNVTALDYVTETSSSDRAGAGAPSP